MVNICRIKHTNWMTPSSVIADTPQREIEVKFGQQGARDILFSPTFVMLHPHLLDELFNNERKDS